MSERESFTSTTRGLVPNRRFVTHVIETTVCDNSRGVRARLSASHPLWLIWRDLNVPGSRIVTIVSSVFAP